MFGDFWVTVPKIEVLRRPRPPNSRASQPERGVSPIRQTPFGTEQKELYELSFRINNLRAPRRPNIQELIVHYTRCHVLIPIRSVVLMFDCSPVLVFYTFCQNLTFVDSCAIL